MSVLTQQSAVGLELPEFACQFTLAHFKRADEATIHTDMEAAKREYLALLEAEAAKGKGGRPKKKPAKPETDEVPPEDVEE